MVPDCRDGNLVCNLHSSLDGFLTHRVASSVYIDIKFTF